MPVLVCAKGISLAGQSFNADKSPEAWAAGKVYEALEELEVGSRPDKPIA